MGAEDTGASRRTFVRRSIQGAVALTAGAPLLARAATEEAPTPSPADPAAASGEEARTVDRAFATDLVPGDCEYRVALPPDYDPDRERPYPLLLLLHGGGGSRDFLGGVLLPATGDPWSELGSGVVVCPSAGRSFYMNYRDGSEAWETLIVTELLDAVRSEFHVSAERERVAVSGVSMGGMGCLRLAFKYPEVFGTVAAMEPAIEGTLRYDELEPVDTFYRADQYPEKYGLDGVVDAAYWEENHPATIAANAPERLRDLAIMIEAGTEDGLELHRGAEFLHRVLWDRGLKHEYRLVLGADHIGRSLNERFRYACAFIGRQWNPEPVDEEVVAFRKLIAPQRREAGLD